MRFREVEKMILQDGWYEVKQVGSQNHEISLSSNIYTL